jgi:rhodanese-related sulfurtransferase
LAGRCEDEGEVPSGKSGRGCLAGILFPNGTGAVYAASHTPSTMSYEALPEDISVHGVRELLDTAAPMLLLDCRTHEEAALARLPAARVMPMDELDARLDELDSYRHQRIVVYCHAGVRSHLVAQWLRSQGFSRVQNMAGGIDAWSLHVDPSVPRY